MSNTWGCAGKQEPVFAHAAAWPGMFSHGFAGELHLWDHAAFESWLHITPDIHCEALDSFSPAFLPTLHMTYTSGP